MAEVTETQTTETTETQTETQQQQQKVNTPDVSTVKTQAITEYLESLGFENEDDLKNIVNKHKEDEEKNKTELQKSKDALSTTSKELASERELRILAEAKLSAIQQGARPELVDDLVVVAKSKVTKDKDINAVRSEIKEGNTGKIYFVTDEEEEEEIKNKNKNVTRTKVQTQTEKKEETKKEETTDQKHQGTIAARIFANKKSVKKHYFS